MAKPKVTNIIREATEAGKGTRITLSGIYADVVAYRTSPTQHKNHGTMIKVFVEIGGIPGIIGCEKFPGDAVRVMVKHFGLNLASKIENVETVEAIDE